MFNSSSGALQGLWIATREQLARMAEADGCRYLDFDESSANGTPETHSGSIQMFHPECGFEKVTVILMRTFPCVSFFFSCDPTSLREQSS